MERVRDYMDDIGFVYILSQQKENFLYELSKNKMHFEPIYETDVMLYPGGRQSFTIPAKRGQNWKTWKESVLYRIIRMNFLTSVL